MKCKKNYQCSKLRVHAVSQALIFAAGCMIFRTIFSDNVIITIYIRRMHSGVPGRKVTCSKDVHRVGAQNKIFISNTDDLGKKSLFTSLFLVCAHDV